MSAQARESVASGRPPVVLVTGGSRGIGRGIAVHCARAGWSVAVNYRADETAADETIRLCRTGAPNAESAFAAIRADVADAGERERLVAETIVRFGRLDALVNNAGIAPRVRADMLATAEADFADVLAVDLVAPFFLAQLVARHWRETPEGGAVGRRVMVNIGSISADTASVDRPAYCIAKAGLAMSTALWAARLAADGAAVFEVRPGIVATDMTAGVRDTYDALIAAGAVPQGRWGTPDDVGAAVAGLLSGAFRFSTGATIPVDGGLTVRRL